MQNHFPILNFTEIQNLIYQLKHLVGIFFNHRNVFLTLFSQLLFLFQLLNWSHNKRQRCSKFM